MPESVVYLDTAACAELAEVFSYATADADTVRVWVDDGGLKYSVSGRTWSYPPLGSTTNPLDF
jgi:hypothetical protein